MRKRKRIDYKNLLGELFADKPSDEPFHLPIWPQKYKARKTTKHQLPFISALFGDKKLSSNY